MGYQRCATSARYERGLPAFHRPRDPLHKSLSTKSAGLSRYEFAKEHSTGRKRLEMQPGDCKLSTVFQGMGLWGRDRSSVVVWLVVLVFAVALAALGNSEGDISLFAVALATGSLLSISLRNRVLSHQLRRAFVAFFALAFAVAFVAVHATGTRTESVPHLAATLVIELLLLVMALAVEFRHWRGLERVAGAARVPRPPATPPSST